MKQATNFLIAITIFFTGLFIADSLKGQTQTYLAWETPITNYTLINTNQGAERTAGGFGYDKGQLNSVQSIASGESFTFQILLTGHQNFCALIPSKPTGQILADNNDDGTWVGSNAAIRTGLIIGVTGDATARPFSLGAEVGPDEPFANFQWFRFNYSGSSIQIQKSTDGTTFTTFHTITGASGSYFFYYQAITQGAKLEAVYKTSAGGGNQAPVVNAGNDINITLPVNTATLSASASDPDGTVSTYVWEKVSGPAGGGITNPSASSTGISGLGEGTYTYRVTVTDNGGATASDDINIIVATAGNTAVNAGPDQLLPLGTTSATLSGTGVSSSSTDLIIFFGESNASGQAPNTSATALERLARPSVKILNNFNGQIEDLDIDQNNNIDVCGQPTTHGMEIGLADAVEAGRFNNPAYLLKVACAGTRIDQWLNGTGNPSWNEMVRKVDLMKAQMSARGINNPNIVVWMSIGLNDAVQGTPADSFAARINRFKSAFRTKYGATIQFHMTQFHRYRPDLGETAPSAFGHPYVATIDALDAADPLLFAIETTTAGWIPGEEAVHWSYTGFKVIADRMTTSTVNNKVGGSVTWSKLSGPTGGAITNANQLVTTVTGLQTGTYTYRLTVGAATDDVSLLVGQSTSNITTTIIPITDPEILSNGRGAEEWNFQNLVNIPTAAAQTTRPDAYYRWQWYQLQTGPTTYNWTEFDSKVNAAIANGQTFSFGIMSECSGCNDGSNPTDAGAYMGYPLYLHTLMQGEVANSRDWITDGHWIPNWNSPNFLAETKKLYQAINAHIQATSYLGVPYKNVINIVEVRHFGSWGEWHASSYVSDARPSAVGTANGYPTGRLPTVASLDSIISYIVKSLPNFKNTILVSAFDANYLPNTYIAPQVAEFALTITNNTGYVGWRRDQIGDLDFTATYIYAWTVDNTRGVTLNLSDQIMNRYKLAPITAEPPGYIVQDSRGHMSNLPKEVRLFHNTSFGNGNYGTSSTGSIQTDSVRLASKIAGYRIQLNSGSMTSTLTSGSSFNITSNWQNLGLAPVYDKYFAMYTLKNSAGSVVWTDTSSFRPHLFQPATTGTVYSDNFNLPGGIPSGSGYVLSVRIVDSLNYRMPLALAITGRQSDGSYILRQGISVVAGGSNIAPTVSISPSGNQSITFPTNSVNVIGTANDPDGTISSYSWVKISGGSATISSPAAAATAITGLSAGSYVFQLTVTDNGGLTATANVGVTVLSSIPTSTYPIANAGTDSIVTLPRNFSFLNGTLDDGDAVSYKWEKVSGPARVVIVSPASAVTKIESLSQGTYVFRFSAIGNSGATALDETTVTVLPVAVGGRYYITNVSKRQVGSQLQVILKYEDNTFLTITNNGGSPVSSVRQATRTVDGAPHLVAIVFFANNTSITYSYK